MRQDIAKDALKKNINVKERQFLKIAKILSKRLLNISMHERGIEMDVFEKIKNDKDSFNEFITGLNQKVSEIEKKCFTQTTNSGSPVMIRVAEDGTIVILKGNNSIHLSKTKARELIAVLLEILSLKAEML